MIQLYNLATWDPEDPGHPPLALALLGICDNEAEAHQVAELLNMEVEPGWHAGTWRLIREIMFRGPDAVTHPTLRALEFMGQPVRHGLWAEWTDDWHPGLGMADEVERNTFKTWDEFRAALALAESRELEVATS